MGKVLILKWYKSNDKRPLKSHHSVSDPPMVIDIFSVLCLFPDFSFPDKERALTLPPGRRNFALLLSFQGRVYIKKAGRTMYFMSVLWNDCSLLIQLQGRRKEAPIMNAGITIFLTMSPTNCSFLFSPPLTAPLPPHPAGSFFPSVQLTLTTFIRHLFSYLFGFKYCSLFLCLLSTHVHHRHGDYL